MSEGHTEGHIVEHLGTETRDKSGDQLNQRVSITIIVLSVHVHKHIVSFTMYSTTPFYILIATDILATNENILDDQHVIISTKVTRHITHGSGREILWHLKALEVHMLRGTRRERDDSSTMDIIVINYTLYLPVDPYIKKVMFTVAI